LAELDLAELEPKHHLVASQQALDLLAGWTAAPAA
jgi:hypothetical protein